jgi:hypothetical protein
MQRWLFTLLSALVLIPLAACGGPATQGAVCDLDQNDLSGDWISLTGSGQGTDRPDKYARIRFFKEPDGKRKAIYTAGRIAPGNPATNKYTYEYIEVTPLGDVMYSINMFPGKSKQRIERLRKDNRSLGVKFEGRLYIKVDPKRCALVISDMYSTWVKGDEMMDSNPSGTRTYLRANPDEPTLGFVHCDEANQLLPFADAQLDWSKEPQPVDPKAGIFAGEPTYFHYVEKAFQGSKDEVNAELTKAGILPEEGATYDYEIWLRDMAVEGAQKIEVKPDPEDDNRIAWVHTHTFEKSSADGVFIEMHRYKTVAGKRELVGNSCKVVWPEPARTAEEIEEAAKATPN